MTVRLPEKQYGRVSLHFVTPGSVLDISGVDTMVLDMRISTGDIFTRIDRAYKAISIDCQVGNVPLYAPQLSKTAECGRQNRYIYPVVAHRTRRCHAGNALWRDAASYGDEAIFVLPQSWDATFSRFMVRYERETPQKAFWS